MRHPPCVHLVDDDSTFRESLRLLLEVAGHQTFLYGSAEDFLHGFDRDLDVPQCLIVDVRLPGLSGLGLLGKLTADGIDLPVIILTGFADVSVAVQAIKAGARDFIEKPVSHRDLLECVQQALDEDAQRRMTRQQQSLVSEKLEGLSARERDVIALLLAAKNTKEIAAMLKISPQTVAKHRASILSKLNVNSVPALLRLDQGENDLSQHNVTRQLETS